MLKEIINSDRIIEGNPLHKVTDEHQR